MSGFKEDIDLFSNAKVVLLVIGFLTIGLSSSAQSNPEFVSALDETTFSMWYDEQFGSEMYPVYNGTTYPLVKRIRFGHAFFGSGQWEAGTILMDGLWYANEFLLFDLIDQFLVVRPPDLSVPFGIEVDMNRVEAFTIGDSHFVNESDFGIMEVLYIGENFDIYLSQVKTIDLQASGSYAKEKLTYYIKIEDAFHEIRNKRSLAILHPESASLAREIRTSETKFNLQDKEMLVRFFQQFDQRLN